MYVWQYTTRTLLRTYMRRVTRAYAAAAAAGGNGHSPASLRSNVSIVIGRGNG